MSSPARGSGEFRSAGRKEHPRRNGSAGLAGVAVGGLGQDPLTVIQFLKRNRMERYREVVQR